MLALESPRRLVTAAPQKLLVPTAMFPVLGSWGLLWLSFVCLKLPERCVSDTITNPRQTQGGLGLVQIVTHKMKVHLDHDFVNQ